MNYLMEPEKAPAPDSMLPQSAATPETAYGYPRDFMGNRFVYTVVSPRARGLSIGINCNPDKHCNFDCAYCEVDRQSPASNSELDVEVMATELANTLNATHSGTLRELQRYRSLPEDLLTLRHVTLSGDGEPTLSSSFREIVQAVVHVRALGRVPYFKIVLVTNATGLDSTTTREGLRLLTRRDEVWAKLDAGTQEDMDRINRSDTPLEKILANILDIGRRRPIMIQSLFAAYNGSQPTPSQIEQYAKRLLELKEAGALISLVQIYSANRPTPHPECGHLPLRTLSVIAQSVREITGLKTEVF